MISHFIFSLLLFFLSFTECYSCKFCQTVELQDADLNVKYCPRCVGKYRCFWNFFIHFTKAKKMHISESYLSQYTPLDFINKNVHFPILDNYKKTILIEFINAVQNKLDNKVFFFKNLDLKILFFSLFEQEEYNEEEKEDCYYHRLLIFYRSLKYICIALFYECQNEGKHQDVQFIQCMKLVLEAIDTSIAFSEITQATFEKSIQNENSSFDDLILPFDKNEELLLEDGRGPEKIGL